MRVSWSALLAIFLVLSSLQAAEWTRFRGPDGLGVVETDGIPDEFGPEKNVVWKTPLPTGKSSPVYPNRACLRGARQGGVVVSSGSIDKRLHV